MSSVKIHTTPDEQTWLDLRRRNINSSEVAALFGYSPYLTLYELWNVKAGELENSFTSNDRVEAGQFLEPSIAAWAAHKLGVEARPFKDYHEDHEARMGSSFD
ncbi:YqaJ viral recombinase family protein [Roseovarius indicus]|uniref:YqaJ viral recombinase family protein n=1 Tax=Roseovarius indicus TaxID=540747 RepID=UPI0032EC893B